MESDKQSRLDLPEIPPLPSDGCQPSIQIRGVQNGYVIHLRADNFQHTEYVAGTLDLAMYLVYNYLAQKA
jgi:hypothetical protein